MSPGELMTMAIVVLGIYLVLDETAIIRKSIAELSARLPAPKPNVPDITTETR